MAATGYTPIYLYYSSTTSNTPSAGNLGYGELAINITDKNLFFKDNTNAVNTVPIRQSSGSSNGWLSSTDWSTFNGKQAALVSGTNIKTVSGTTVLGSGDLGTIGTAYGGTGLTGFTAANNAIYSSSSSALTAGTLPIAAGGTAQTSFTSGRIHYGSFSTSANLTTDGTDLTLGAGNLVIGTSGKGIDFSATAGTGTSELLADYEEGTWTPTFTASGTALSSVTYSIQQGAYTKIGNIVYYTAFVRTSAVTIGSATGNIGISGLPYTSAATYEHAATIGSVFGWGGDYPISGMVSSSTSRITLYYRTAVNGQAYTTEPADLATANNNDIYISGFYRV